MYTIKHGGNVEVHPAKNTKKNPEKIGKRARKRRTKKILTNTTLMNFELALRPLTYGVRFIHIRANAKRRCCLAVCICLKAKQRKQSSFSFRIVFPFRFLLFLEHI